MVHVVGAAIVRDGLVLAARRGTDRQLAGLWEFPGGKVEADEAPTVALTREIREELALEIRVGAHLETTTYPYSFASITLETYIATIASGEPVASEHSEIRWCAPFALEELEWAPADMPAVKRLVAMLRTDEHQRPQN